MVHLKRIPQGICLTISSREQYLWDYRRILPWISLENIQMLHNIIKHSKKRIIRMLKKVNDLEIEFDL